MTVFRMFANSSKLTFSLFLIMAWLISSGDLFAQSYWEAIFELGYEPITQKVNHARACRRIEDIHRFRELISDHLIADQTLLIKIRDLDSRITSLDVANVYDFLPYSDADGVWRAIAVRGQSDFNAYRLNVVDPDIEDRLFSSTDDSTGIAGSQGQFGDIGLGIFIRPVRKDTFKFRTQARLYLDDIPAANVMRVINGMLITTWAHATGAENLPMEISKECALDRQSARILNRIANDFPDFFRITSQYCDIEKLVSSDIKNTGDSLIFCRAAGITC